MRARFSVEYFRGAERVWLCLTVVVLVSRRVREWVKCGHFFYVRQTSAYPLFLPGQDSRSIDDTDALQDWVRHLGTHEPAKYKTGMREGTAQGRERRKRK